MWSLYENNEMLKPLIFSNGKTQEDVVKEIINAIDGHRVIFIKGVCGSGKSAISLNLAKEIGKASVVVPVKALQKQYEDDYMGKKYLLKENGRKLKIQVITGRANHICPYLQEQEQKGVDIKKILGEKNFKLSDFEDKDNYKDEDNDTNESNKKFGDNNTSNTNINKSSINKYIFCDNPFLPCRIAIKEKNAKRIR